MVLSDCGATVQLFPWHGGTNQQFGLVIFSGGHFGIMARHSGLTIEVPDQPPISGLPLQQAASTGTPNQHWIPFLDAQPDWRWCHKCQGMWMGDNLGSHCPAGGEHEKVSPGLNSLNYELSINNPTAGGWQGDWRWCQRCQGLFFGGNPGSVCPAGGAHDGSLSSNYSIPQFMPPSRAQDNWRWCHKCQGMYFAGLPGPVCPAGGPHENVGSGDYSMMIAEIP